jgi:hypothetical protein
MRKRGFNQKRRIGRFISDVYVHSSLFDKKNSGLPKRENNQAFLLGLWAFSFEPELFNEIKV